MTRFAAFRYGPLGVALMVAATVCARADTIVLPTFDVVATTPAGGEIDVAKFPGAVWQTGAEDIQTWYDTTVDGRPWRARRRASPSATSRATISSPTSAIAASTRRRSAGTPIGLAVYQNGVRINEAFGDTVNWDLIPTNAIDKMTIGRPATRSTASTRSAARSA